MSAEEIARIVARVIAEKGAQPPTPQEATVAHRGAPVVTLMNPKTKKSGEYPVAVKNAKTGKIQILNPESLRPVINQSTLGKKVVAGLSTEQRRIWAEGVHAVSNGSEKLAEPSQQRSRSPQHQSKASRGIGGTLQGVGDFGSQNFSRAFRANPSPDFIARVAQVDPVFANELSQIAQYVNNGYKALISTKSRGDSRVIKAFDVGTPSHLKAIIEGQYPEIISEEEFKALRDAKKNDKTSAGAFTPHTVVPGVDLAHMVHFGSEKSVALAASDSEKERRQIAAWLAQHPDRQDAVNEFRNRVSGKRASSPATAASASRVTRTVRAPSPVASVAPVTTRRAFNRPTITRRASPSP